MSGSVLDKAVRVQSEAARLQTGAEAEGETKRVNKRVNELSTHLSNLKTILTVARALQSLPGGVDVDLSSIDSGLEAFRAKALGPPPTNTVFTSAGNKVQAVSNRLTPEVADAWAVWTNRIIADLPLERIIVLPPERRTEVNGYRAELMRLAKAKAKVPDLAQIRLFHRNADLIDDHLRDVPDPPKEVIELIQRLDERPRLSIDQITDEQIRLLRESGIADQIELHRRGA